MVSHKPAYIVLIAITWLILLAVFFFNAILSFDQGVLNWGIFLNNSRDSFNAYSLEITPAGWTFSIWGAIYAWQALLMVYTLTTICRKSDKGYLYYSPPFLHWSFYIFYSVNLAGNIAWIFLWDRNLIQIAFPVLACIAASLYVCIGISVYGIYKYYPDLVRCGHAKEPWLVIAFVHNGLGVYAAWASFATLLNMAIFLTFSLGVDQTAASTIALGALTFVIFMYMMFDLVLFERYLRFMLTPYLVVIVALIGSLDKNWNPNKSSPLFSVSLLAVVTMAMVIKISLVIWKQRVEPVFCGVGRKGEIVEE